MWSMLYTHELEEKKTLNVLRGLKSDWPENKSYCDFRLN